MSTNEHTSANRTNTNHSTGPKTAAGKAISAMNSLRHGLRATTLILPGESQEDFDRIHTQLQNLYLPQNATEQQLVDSVANIQWKLLRAELFEGASYGQADSPAGHVAILDRTSQILCRLQRSWFRLIKDLERIKAARPVPGPPPENKPESPPPAAPKNGKKEYQPPPNLTYAWVDPETGARQVFYQTKDGVRLDIPLYPDDPPAPGDKSDPPVPGDKSPSPAPGDKSAPPPVVPGKPPTKA